MFVGRVCCLSFVVCCFVLVGVRCVSLLLLLFVVALVVGCPCRLLLAVVACCGLLWFVVCRCDLFVVVLC